MFAVLKPKPVCSYEILKHCVAPKKEMLLKLRSIENGRFRAYDCNCLQNCVGSDVFILGYQELSDTKDLLGTIGGILLVKEYPVLRYKRKILFSLTDFWGNTLIKYTLFFLVKLRAYELKEF